MAKKVNNSKTVTIAITLMLGILPIVILKEQITSESLFWIRLSQTYALFAIGYLYGAMIIGPLYKVFPNLPFKTYSINTRKAIGISAFIFACLHASISFFKLLGGLPGLAFLSERYMQAISISALALIILAGLAASSINSLSKATVRFRALLSRCLYGAGILILIHALMLGTHFSDVSQTIPQIVTIALCLLLSLELIKIHRYVSLKIAGPLKYAPTVFLVLLIVLAYSNYLKEYLDGTKSANIHATHTKTSTPTSQQYKVVSLSPTENLQAGQSINLKMKIEDLKQPNTTPLLKVVHEKQLHVIVLDSQLQHFEHVHPEVNQAEFTLNTVLPYPGYYLVYADYQPLGAPEQISTLSLIAGDSRQSLQKNNQTIDTNFKKNTEEYQVELISTEPLKAELITKGVQGINFSVYDKQSQKPLTDLQPYLGAYGHLVLINRDNFEYIHIHPTQLVNQSGNNQLIEFKAMPNQKPITPGVYRAFAQFQRNDKLFVADYTINIE